MKLLIITAKFSRILYLSSRDTATDLLAGLHDAAARGADLLRDLLTRGLGVCLLHLLLLQLALLHGPLLALLADVDHAVLARPRARRRPRGSEVPSLQLQRRAGHGRLGAVGALAPAPEHRAAGHGDWKYLVSGTNISCL